MRYGSTPAALNCSSCSVVKECTALARVDQSCVALRGDCPAIVTTTAVLRLKLRFGVEARVARVGRQSIKDSKFGLSQAIDSSRSLGDNLSRMTLQLPFPACWCRHA